LKFNLFQYGSDYLEFGNDQILALPLHGNGTTRAETKEKVIKPMGEAGEEAEEVCELPIFSTFLLQFTI
jgi:hypothetical protein